MSNLLTESCLHTEQFATPEPSYRLAESLGSRIIQLSGGTLTDILDGKLPISDDCLIYDPNGRRVETALLLNEVEVA